MAKLGEAYVRIRGDLEPLGKDVDRGLKTMSERIEKGLNKKFGQTIGKNIGGGIRDGLRETAADIGDEFGERLSIPANNRRVGRKAGQDFGDGYGEGIFGSLKRIAGLTITALEDGFSSLPPQVKGVVGAALIAALVPAGALAGAALAGAIVGGTVGIGVALASQFSEVESEFQYFTDRLRKRAVRSAEPFAGEVIASLDFFDRRLDQLDPKIRSLFSNAARYVEPLTRGLAGATEGLINGLEEGFANADFDGISLSLEQGLTNLGDTLGDQLGSILANPDTPEAIADLVETVEDLVYIGGEFIDWTVTAWSALKQGVEVVDDFGAAIGSIVKLITEVTSVGDNWSARVAKQWDDVVFRWTDGEDQVHAVFGNIKEEYRGWNNESTATIKLTEEQIKAQKELNKVLDDQVELVNDIISSQISYQAAIDETIAGFKEYGTSLKLADEDGRRNAENIQNQINALNEQVKSQVEAGQLTDAEAKKFYDREIARLRSEFKERGGNLKQFDELFAKLIQLQQAPLVPNKLGPFAAALAPIVKALREIDARTQAIREQGLPSTHNRSGVGPGQQKYADGGFITRPTNAIMGENYREEVVLPLTDTRRSLQLLGQSRLAGMLGGGTSVAVYIGDEQLNSRMYRVASASNRATARKVSQTPRMV